MSVRRWVVVSVGIAALVALVWFLLAGRSHEVASRSGADPSYARTSPNGAAGAEASRHGRSGATRRIAGTVLGDDARAGMAGATVRLIPVGGERELATTRTDAAGRFDFGQVIVIDYFVVAEAPRSTGATLRVDLRDVRTDRPPDQLRLVLHACQASIFGVVADTAGGTISGARLEVVDDGLGGPGAESAENGAYELCMPIGGNGVIVRADGYASVELQVTASGRVHRDVAMAPEAAVGGKVVRADTGEGVAGATVSLRPDDFARALTAPMIRATSDVDGTFRLRGVMPGRHVLFARAEGFASESETPVIAEVDTPVDDIVCEVVPTRSIAGKVIDRQTKEPLAGESIYMRSRDRDDPSAIATSVTHTDGTFLVEGVLPGTYTPGVASQAMDRKPRELTVGTSDLKDVVLEADRLGSIAGRVTRKGKPVDGAKIMVQQRWTATSDADGHFLVRGLQPGTVEVYAESRRLGAFTKGPTVTLAAGQAVTGVAVEMDLAASVAGTVVDQNGAPVAGVSLRFSLAAGSDFGDATTGEDGSFTITALSGGGDYVYGVYDAKAMAVAYHSVSGKRFAPVAVPTADSHVTGLRIQIAYERKSITGRVLAHDGSPAPDVVVTADPRGNASWSSPHATTDVSGSFTLKDLPAGTYTLRASSPAGEQVVPEVAAGTRAVEIRFPGVGTIAGTVDGFKRPPRVMATGVGGAMYRAMVRGTAFTIKNVPEGEYTVIAQSSDGFATDHVNVASGSKTTVTLANAGVGKIEGRVVNGSTHQPVAGLYCSSMDGDGERSDEAGAFHLDHVLAGPASVDCFGRNVTAHGAVEVTAGGVARVELVTKERQRPRLGYSGLELRPQIEDVVVARVAAGSPGERAGIKVGDYIRRIDGKALDHTREYARWMIDGRPAGEKVSITLERDDKEQTVELTLDAAPAAP